MLKLVTSLSFLYALTFLLLLWCGLSYYSGLSKPGRRKKLFLPVFFIISLACGLFLWFNIHSPLKLKAYSNLDHYFIRHDGFDVSENIELGKTDTVHSNRNSFNRFNFFKQNKEIKIASAYSEEPFYISANDRYKIVSVNYPASGHSIFFQYDSIKVRFLLQANSSFELTINSNNIFKVRKEIKKGITAWNIFRDENSFINSGYYTNEKLINCLKNIFLLRDDVSRTEYSEAKYFLSGKIFNYSTLVRYDEKEIKLPDLTFQTSLADNSRIAWGIGFWDNNKNQFLLKKSGKDSFSLLNRFPLSYPLTEENNPDSHRDDWSPHTVGKFLVSNSDDLLNMPAVFREGFLFPSSDADSSNYFSPVLLNYEKASGNSALQVKAKFLNRPKSEIELGKDRFLLPAGSGSFRWIFSLRNTYNWEFGSRVLTSSQWQLRVFGLLTFFFLLVFLSALFKPVDKISWVWQLLSCITIVLLTTRLFLYWRYKSFPPYEGMDLPSQQQLQSIWNFWIIIYTGVLLAIIFGFDLLKNMYSFFRKKIFYAKTVDGTGVDKLFVRKIFPGNSWLKPKAIFFSTWLLLLACCYGFVAIKHFDANTCRHISLLLIAIYFIYLFISYKHSPLVTSAEKSWWKINTATTFNVIVSNPVKILLSISLLAAFVFIDIGFAIVFLNFLLFNEAFLCINYAVSGLSAGSGKNRKIFIALAIVYVALFVANLLFAPYFLGYVLLLPQIVFTLIFSFFFLVVALNLIRVFGQGIKRIRIITALVVAVPLIAFGYYKFIPKEMILEKAQKTKYRVDVLTMPTDKAIELAYEEGKNYEPVIRAAQNQWFINTFIYEKNNPAVNSFAFHLLPHAPQNKGAKYNAQATDLVASRFLIAEHGKWSVLLYVLLLILPVIMLAPFYKLYPDFTNRVNTNYPTVTVGFTVLNYLLISALLVILAATGKYIFFGQDMPFGSILSKQSVLFPSLLIIATVFLFSRVPLEYYSNRKKNIPGLIVFSGLAVLLLFVKPSYNKNKEFTVNDLAKDFDSYIQLKLQPVLNYFDTSKTSRRLPIARKDELFSDSIRKLLASGFLVSENKFFEKEITNYTRTDFSRHIDPNKIIYLDLYSGNPELAVNENYFRIEPPPHLQQSWAGNVYGDTTVYNITLWDKQTGALVKKRLSDLPEEANALLDKNLLLSFRNPKGNGLFQKLYLVNTGNSFFQLKIEKNKHILRGGDSILLFNPYHFIITDPATSYEKEFAVEPDAFMKNFFVNGSRFYAYPMSNHFIWARNFAESISGEYAVAEKTKQNVFISFDFEIMDSLSAMMQKTIGRDTAYKKGAEYGICIADGNGRLIAMNDLIKGMIRPDPNNKAEFNDVIAGNNGFISQSVLRKQIGNINLLRLNPGPGSTLKPIVFSSIASQLNINWDQFASDGFSKPQKYFGGERVNEYDFEEYHGLITKLVDYFRLSDNYFHSNVLLLGSYPKQDLQKILANYFVTKNPDDSLHWPYFSYNGMQYWLDGFENWPGYAKGKVNFGSDSSFVSIGLMRNYGIYNHTADKSFDRFTSSYDSLLFGDAWRKSGFLLPEYALFDQQGTNVNRNIPYDVFASCFRGHVKGSSQVLTPPAKLTEAFGKLVTQNRNYSLTLNPYASSFAYSPFYIDSSIGYNNYLSLMRESVFAGMREALFKGTAQRLGMMLKNGAPYYYYAKTGTTGDNDAKTKSKLFVIVISAKDITNPDFTFKNFNQFYTIYFTSQNGPNKQNEEFQKKVIQFVQNSAAFRKLMNRK